MGVWMSSLIGWISSGAALDTTPDPATGLSQQDIHLIRTTWALASDRKVVKQNGVELFIHIFHAHPHMRAMFPMFKGMSDDELRQNPKMKAHGLTVMYALGNYVRHLDEPETLVGLVEKVAASHIQKDIRTDDFEKLAKLFIPYLRSLLGDQCTPEIEKAWTRLLDAQTALVANVEKEMGS